MTIDETKLPDLKWLPVFVVNYHEDKIIHTIGFEIPKLVTNYYSSYGEAKFYYWDSEHQFVRERSYGTHIFLNLEQAESRLKIERENKLAALKVEAEKLANQISDLEK